MANAVVEVQAPRDITRQLLRHRSFSFQEFSQRYSDEIEFTDRDFRRQDTKNRQNSIDDLSPADRHNYITAVGMVKERATHFYKWLIQEGVAKECARVILPEGLTMSKLYVNGTLRSWLTYLDVRLDKTTQLEHRMLAEKIRGCLDPVFPNVFSAVSKNDS
jgi:thymidylate synthase (FAD)